MVTGQSLSFPGELQWLPANHCHFLESYIDYQPITVISWGVTMVTSQSLSFPGELHGLPANHSHFLGSYNGYQPITVISWGVTLVTSQSLSFPGELQWLPANHCHFLGSYNGYQPITVIFLEVTSVTTQSLSNPRKNRIYHIITVKWVNKLELKKLRRRTRKHKTRTCWAMSSRILFWSTEHSIWSEGFLREQGNTLLTWSVSFTGSHVPPRYLENITWVELLWYNWSCSVDFIRLNRIIRTKRMNKLNNEDTA